MTERHMALMRILCRRRHETISNLAAEFGVSERTIRRDVETLGLTEPIYTQQGRYGGGVYVTDNYHMDSLYLGEAETALLNKILRHAQSGRVCTLTSEDVCIIEKILTEHTKPQKHEYKERL